jgi:hypothetical protein
MHPLWYWPAFAAIFGVVAVVVCLMWLLHMASDYAERQTPAFRLELEAAYASFHRFLSAVRCAALRAVLSPPTFCTFPREFSSFGRQGL